MDCGSLSDPANGYVAHLGGTTFESQAEYRCNDGYYLSYPARRTCLSSGLWSATAPTCDPEPICKEKVSSQQWQMVSETTHTYFFLLSLFSQCVLGIRVCYCFSYNVCHFLFGFRFDHEDKVLLQASQ